MRPPKRRTRCRRAPKRRAGRRRAQRPSGTRSGRRAARSGRPAPRGCARGDAVSRGQGLWGVTRSAGRQEWNRGSQNPRRRSGSDHSRAGKRWPVRSGATPDVAQGERATGLTGSGEGSVQQREPPRRSGVAPARRPLHALWSQGQGRARWDRSRRPGGYADQGRSVRNRDLRRRAARLWPHRDHRARQRSHHALRP